MGKQQKAIRVEDLSGESKRIFDVLNEEIDLAVALIGTSFLSACLEKIIFLSFSNRGSTATEILDPNKGCLGSFVNRARLLYCLGHIGKPRFQDLEIIGQIRNRFAHEHLQVTFEDPKVAAFCKRLKVPDWSSGMKSEEYLQYPRRRFVLTVAVLSQVLLLKALELEREGEK